MCIILATKGSKSVSKSSKPSNKKMVETVIKECMIFILKFIIIIISHIDPFTNDIAGD